LQKLSSPLKWLNFLRPFVKSSRIPKSGTIQYRMQLFRPCVLAFDCCNLVIAYFHHQVPQTMSNDIVAKQ
ncbi:MAG: hypothetical protein Q4B94_11105, partial [Pseudomonadota bacterium]|nr:hypothetical protein [Pseudomonadota bacterium]